MMPDVAESLGRADVILEAPPEGVHIRAHFGGPLVVTERDFSHLDIPGTRDRVSELVRYNGTQYVRWKLRHTGAETDPAGSEKLPASPVRPSSRVLLPLKAELREVLAIDAPLA
jgi:hypothetical protein